MSINLVLSKIPRSIYFGIFTLSGFSGLIYESIWSHYLKLFLGHAAYAQSLVLAIFMGGMAIGSWLASRYSTRSKSLLLWYAIVEAIIGMAALLFHNTFINLTSTFYTVWLPLIGPNPLAHFLKWTLAALFIMPQE
ncbi:hypothetical protein TI04_11120 [Achromatium sp. WMS2]|nr:hypothetical protein TI04_11120 [Achromatium sp. WMS2]